MARIKGGQRLMQMSQRRGSAPQAQTRTMVPGGMADRMQQGRGPVGGIPMAEPQLRQTKSKSGGILKNFGKGLSNVFGKISQASRLARQAGEMQRIEGELGGIAGQIDGMTKAKEQFDQGVDELSQAIVQNHIESVGLDAMMGEMKQNQEAQRVMRMMQTQARQSDTTPGDIAELNVLGGGVQANQQSNLIPANAVNSLMNNQKSVADFKGAVNAYSPQTGSDYPEFDYGEDALYEFDRLIAAGDSLPDFIKIKQGRGRWRVVDVAKEIPSFAPFVRSSSTEKQRRDIQSEIKRLSK